MTAVVGLGSLVAVIALNVVVIAWAGMRRDRLTLREWWRS